MNASLRDHIDAAGSTDTGCHRQLKIHGSGGAVDWKQLVEELAKQSYGVGKSRAIRLLKHTGIRWTGRNGRQTARDRRSRSIRG